MEFGVQFFPDVRPQEKSGAAYFSDAVALAEEADELGFTHILIRTAREILDQMSA